MILKIMKLEDINENSDLTENEKEENDLIENEQDQLHGNNIEGLFEDIEKLENWKNIDKSLIKNGKEKSKKKKQTCHYGIQES